MQDLQSVHPHTASVPWPSAPSRRHPDAKKLHISLSRRCHREQRRQSSSSRLCPLPHRTQQAQVPLYQSPDRCSKNRNILHRNRHQAPFSCRYHQLHTLQCTWHW